MKINEPTEVIIGFAYRVHNELGPNLAEKVYENSLMIEIELAGIPTVQ
jgi:GxxExxY protein